MDNAARAAASTFTRPVSGDPANDSTVPEGTLRQRRVSVQSPVQPRPGSNSLQAGQVGGGNRQRVPVSRTATAVGPLARRLEVAEPGHFPHPHEAASLHARRAKTRSVDSPSPAALSQRPLTPRHPLPLSVPPLRKPPTLQPSVPPLQPESPCIASIAAPPSGSDASSAGGGEPPAAFTRMGQRPWLSREDDMVRRLMCRAMGEFLKGPYDSKPHFRYVKLLWDVVNPISRMERDVTLINALTKKSGISLLCEREWLVLSQLVSYCEERVSSFHPRSIFHLAQREDLRSEFGDLSLELPRRIVDIQKFLDSRDVTRILKRTSTQLPFGEGKQAVVYSRVTPGTVLGRYFEGDYPPDGLIDGKRPPYQRALGLAQTSLVNCSGQLLYSGLRNCPSQPITPDSLLLQLDDEELKSTFADLDVKAGRVRDVGGRRVVEDRFYAWQAELIKKHDTLLQAYAHEMMDRAASSIERDLLAAALVTDPEKFSQAKDGKTVSLGLCVIQAGHESPLPKRKKWDVERLADPTLGTDLPELHCRRDAHVRLNLRGVHADAELHSVPVVVQIREFGVLNDGAEVRGITTAPESASGCSPDPGGSGNTPAARWTVASSVERLLGPADSRKLGGDAESRHLAMDAQVHRKRKEIAELERQHRQSCLDPGGSHSASTELLDRIERVRQEAATIEKNARTLVQAGRQVKRLLAPSRKFAGLASLCNYPITVEIIVASRLALISHLMGETPVLCCVDSRVAARLDAEVKFLATVADSKEGHLPIFHERPDAWRRARTQFRAGLADQAGDFLDGTRWQSTAETAESTARN